MVGVFLVVGMFFGLIVFIVTKSRTSILLSIGSLCMFIGLSGSMTSLRSEIKQVWGLQEVSSECDLSDHELPTRNMKCYVTNGKGHKELVEIRVSKDGTKLGLYDTNSKALRQTEKE